MGQTTGQIAKGLSQADIGTAPITTSSVDDNGNTGFNGTPQTDVPGVPKQTGRKVARGALGAIASGLQGYANDQQQGQRNMFYGGY